MTDDQKILQLEEELKRIASELDTYRKEIARLKAGNLEEPLIKSVEAGSSPVPKRKISSSTDDAVTLENFIGLKLLHLAGIVVLVIGISIGVKYAVDKELISPVARIILAYSAGAVLYFLSVRLKPRFELFSAILFSGAMASLYFTTYAAFVYYQLFTFSIAFAIMAAITIFTAYTAIRYNKQEIAILGMIGAYGIPFLISSNSGRIDLFFTYISIINAGILFLAWKKEWKAMVRLAMLVSWTLFIGWAFTNYNELMQRPAVIIMFVLYTMFAFASAGFSIRKKQPLDLVEVQLFLSNNLLAFVAALLVVTEATLDQRSQSVTGFAFVVFALQALAAKSFLPSERVIFNWLIAFAVLSGVCFVGMKWDGVAVTMIWLLMAIALFVAGVISKTGWLRLLYILLMGVTLGKLVLLDRNSFTTGQKIISYISIGILLLLLSYFYQQFKQQARPRES